ncbi:MAG: hypothetical protein V4773_11365 [Verrucomicrobiota bacterium]
MQFLPSTASSESNVLALLFPAAAPAAAGLGAAEGAPAIAGFADLIASLAPGAAPATSAFPGTGQPVPSTPGEQSAVPTMATADQPMLPFVPVTATPRTEVVRPLMREAAKPQTTAGSPAISATNAICLPETEVATAVAGASEGAGEGEADVAEDVATSTSITGERRTTRSGHEPAVGIEAFITVLAAAPISSPEAESDEEGTSELEAEDTLLGNDEAPHSRRESFASAESPETPQTSAATIPGFASEVAARYAVSPSTPRPSAQPKETPAHAPAIEQGRGDRERVRPAIMAAASTMQRTETTTTTITSAVTMPGARSPLPATTAPAGEGSSFVSESETIELPVPPDAPAFEQEAQAPSDLSSEQSELPATAFAQPAEVATSRALRLPTEFRAVPAAVNLTPHASASALPFAASEITQVVAHSAAAASFAAPAVRTESRGFTTEMEVDSAGSSTGKGEIADLALARQFESSTSGRENFADDRGRDSQERSAEESASEINFVSTVDKQVTKRSKELGTAVANSSAVMPHHTASATLPSHPAFEYADVAVSAVQSSGGVAADAAALAPEAVSDAQQAVEVVLQTIDRAAEREQTVVKMEFSVGDADLQVRVELDGGEVRTTFRTESPELRAALAREWQAVSSGSGEPGGVRLAPAVISDSERSSTNSSTDSGSQRHERQAARQDDGSSTLASFARSHATRSSASAASGAVAHSSFRPLAPAGTAQRLHLFA